MSYKEVFVILFFLLATGTVAMMPAKTTPATATIDGKVYKLEVADNTHERVQGLSGRESIPADEALLFVYNAPTYPSIWMKDMNFPIDIIWLDTEWQVVHMERNVSPSTFPKTFRPKTPAQYVIELRGGSI